MTIRGELAWRQMSGDQITAADLYAVLRLRSQVFVDEQQSAYVDVDGLDLLADVVHLIARESSVPGVMACARVIGPGVLDERVHIGRVVVAPAGRGRGLGADLLTRAIEVSRTRWPGVGLALSAQVHLVAMYARHGFVAVGDPYDDGGIAHLTMVADAP